MVNDTAKWVVTTVTSYLLVLLFVLGHLANPVIQIDETLSVGLLLAGLAGLGITNVSAFNAVQTRQALSTKRK